MEATKTLSLNTHELRMGDIVHTHGMRVLLDTEPGERTETMRNHRARGTRIVWFRGTVLNRDEVVAAGHVPASWLYERESGRAVAEDARDDRWTIQGNELARWAVERPA